MHKSSRRTFIRSAAMAAAALPGLGSFDVVRAAAPRPKLHLGEAQPFSFEGLTEQARGLSRAAYHAPYRPAPDVVKQIDYEAHGKIHYDADRALFGREGAYPVTFFHLGQLFPSSVKMHEVSGTVSREILYSPDYFEMPEDSVARQLPQDAGFAGFRLHEFKGRSDWRTQDWVAFLGASYFRTIGALGQYGLSARGLAVNTTASGPEEFPIFTEFFLQRARGRHAPLTIFALLDGPSVTGAYRFECHREKGVVMDVSARIFLRKDVEQLGVAPLTSMFWYDQQARPYRLDWRPEVHDSDGLVMATGTGEHLFRPLNSPRRVVTSSFLDRDIKGFGLVQRDRDPEHYLDGVNYHLRPTLWVEPKGDWGEGAVQLVEIPTDDEIHDNIAAFWRPKAPAKAGAELSFDYRLSWQADIPSPPRSLAQVSATRIGRGGEAGKPRPAHVTKFVVEFEGAALGKGPRTKLPAAKVATTLGQASAAKVEWVPHTGRVRAVFDLAIQGTESAELRLFLERDGQPVSETWLYQYDPAPRA